MELSIKLYFYLCLSLIAGIIWLHSLPRWGKLGKNISEFCCCAPGIDLVLGYFMLFPVVMAMILMGWAGIFVALAAELSVLWLWILGHEFAYRDRDKGLIFSTLSGIFGKWRNHLAVWITALAIPVFWVVRFAEIIVYPPLTKLIGLPSYNAKEWVNVSRHKFEGLIGYDLIWCLYCDWMTGVWSLGTEMLRNVESFWCPIRFYSDKKCENCKQDFPDIENGWVAADGNMTDVARVLKEKYDGQQDSSWYGHPCRQQTTSEQSAVQSDDSI
jgi:hypothetical protein